MKRSVALMAGLFVVLDQDRIVRDMAPPDDYDTTDTIR